MATVILQSGNPLDLATSELSALANAIGTEAGVDVEIVQRDVRRGPQAVTLHEVLSVWVPAAATVARILPIIVKWMRKRFVASPGRPRTTTIFGPDGKPLKVVTLVEGNGDVQDHTSESPENRLPPA